MITGGHIMMFSRDADADRAFLRDVVKLDHVDAGGGWLIFALKGAEMGLHPAEKNGLVEFYLMCDDIEAEVARLTQAGARCTPIAARDWGRLTTITLPSGGAMHLYQPTHPSAI